MTSTTIVEQVSEALSNSEVQVQTLHRLLTLSARGYDLTAAAEPIHRYILRPPPTIKSSSASSTINAQVLSLALDIVLTSPSHSNWVDTLAILAYHLRNPVQPTCLVALLKIPHLPHAALQHLLLYSTTALTNTLENPPSPSSTRRAAVHAISTIVLRTRPLTAAAPDDDGIRLQKLTDTEQLLSIRRGVERLLFALLEATFDKEDSVAVAALSQLTNFAYSSLPLSNHAPIDASKKATSTVIWQVLIASLPKLSDRFARIFGQLRDMKSSQHNNAIKLYGNAITSFAHMASYALSQKDVDDSSQQQQLSHNDNDNDNEETIKKETLLQQIEDAKTRAVKWIETVLIPLSDNTSMNIQISSNASLSILNICCYANTCSITSDKTYTWGSKAVKNLIHLLSSSNDTTIPSVVASNWVRDISFALAALSKSDSITTKFLSSSTITILPYAATTPSQTRRLQLLALLCSTSVEHDLSSASDASAGGNSGAVRALLKSKAWSSILQDGQRSKTQQDDQDDSKNTYEDDEKEIAGSSIGTELICSMGIAILEAARKISLCNDPGLQLQLTHSWAVMLSHVLRACVPCLSWKTTVVSNSSSSSSSIYAKEIFLKLFTAAGQYSSFLFRTQGIGMEEYERMQEILVKLTLKQENVLIRSSLLVCTTKYWLSSGIKAESNVGHIIKAIWKHLQDHFHDAEIFKQELRTGALWSDAKQGLKTPLQKSIEGGYVSMATKIGKKSKQVFGNVNNSVVTAIENRLFESIALSTAAEEGSTLKTDYVYAALNSLISIVSHNHSVAGKSVKILEKYINVLEQAESSDYIALEAVRNTILILKTYEDVKDENYLPKHVPVRTDMGLDVGSGLGWLQSVSDNCVFASSRLTDGKSELETVSSEEAILHASALTKRKLLPFRAGSMHDYQKINLEETSNTSNSIGGSYVVEGRDKFEGDSQILHGTSDPFGIIVTHTMDAVKALALLHVRVTNRSQYHRAENVSLSYSASGALSPLPDIPTRYSLGILESNATVSQHITVSVNTSRNENYDNFAGRVFLKIHIPTKEKRKIVEQTALPYYVPSADVLLLRQPTISAGVDVFRRRWDSMRYDSKMRVYISETQSLDMMVDLLERKSNCLRAVGRMRVYSHVCTMTADSTRGDFVTVAAVAPEGRGINGIGPCAVYVTIRANSKRYSEAFRDECIDWLSEIFKVEVAGEDGGRKRRVTGEENKLPSGNTVSLQDAYFITEPDGPKLSTYQRWRKAHAIRSTL